MIGSPDVLAFTGTKGFTEDNDLDLPGLPEEHSVPLLDQNQPWSSSAQFQRDFILVAEFSEQVGPRPVLTIPDDPKLIGTFDLNHFSVRIMSVDYQASGPSHHNLAAPGPRLSFTEDSEVILGDSGWDAFAYVHHLTLYDLEARGMVRPFCMAYVSSDQNKLMENFSELSAGLSRAAEILKTGNRQMFSVELQRKLQQLQFTWMSLQQAAPPLVDGTSTELEAVERSISTHRELLRQVTSYPNRKLKQPDFLPYDPADSLTDMTWFPPPEETPPPTTRSKHHLKSLDELCNSYFLSLTRNQLADTELRLRGDRSILLAARVTSWLSRKLSLTNFLFELWRPEEEGESEEAHGATVPDTTEDPSSLDTFCSCVEELAIKLEPTLALTSDLSTQMTGSVSSSDSIEVLGTERSYPTQRADADSSETPSVTSIPAESPLRRPAGMDAGMKRVSSYTRRTNSEDSIEVLSTTESICLEDLTAITEEDTEQSTDGDLEEDSRAEEDQEMTETIMENYDKTQQVQHKDHEKTGVVQEDLENTELVQEDLENNSSENNHRSGEAQDPKWTEPIKEDDDKNKSFTENLNKTMQVDQFCTSDKLDHLGLELDCSQPPESSSLHGAVQETITPTELDQWSLPRPPPRLLSLDEASDCTSSDPSTSSTGASSVRRRRRKAGLRALRFLKENSFCHHAVFCLLSGRALVVLGGDQSRVRKLLDALSLFLPAPGRDRTAVMASLSSPLQMSDLLTCRLIGVHRSASSSSSALLASLTRFSRYLALLDLDQRTLRCPPYSGSLVSRLADPHTSIGRGATYLLYLESGLMALSNQALLHAFACHHGDEEDFLRRRGLSSSDADVSVMRFLSELIVLQHTGRGPAVLRFSYVPAQLHKNSHPT